MNQVSSRYLLILFILAFTFVSGPIVAQNVEINGTEYDAELIKELMRLNESDFITRHDIDRAGGQYKLAIEDFGYIYIEDMYPTVSTSHRKCKVPREIFRRQVRDAFKAGEINKNGHTFLRLMLINEPELGLINVCGTWGTGCYIIVHTD